MSDQGWFLMVYGGLLAALLTASLVTWRRWQPEADDTVDLTDVELAALNGGPQLAAITAATALRRSHVTSTPDGTLVAQGPLADDAGQLERELFDTLRQSPASPAKTLVDNAARGATVQRIVTRLTDAGLRLGDDARLWMTAAWICAGVLVTAGAVAVFAIWEDGVQDWQALAPLAAPVVAAEGVRRWLGRHRSGATAAGRRVLARAKDDRSDELRAAGGQLAFAVAILGSAALWSNDPAFAAALDIPPQTETSIAGNAAAFGWGWDASCGGCGCGGCG